MYPAEREKKRGHKREEGGKKDQIRTPNLTSRIGGQYIRRNFCPPNSEIQASYLRLNQEGGFDGENGL